MSFDNPVVLYVGRLDPGKGLPELIDAHATISHNRDVELLLVGDGSLRTDLKQRVMEHKTTNNVTFTGAVPHEETPHYYASADVFCLPSHSEGFGLANIEAMACGTPVVTTRVGAIPEYIKNGKNGVLVPPANAGELSSAIENLLADPAYRKELAATALADVQRFSWSNQAGMMRRHYQDVVRGSNNT